MGNIITGHFQLKVINPDGSVDQDTGPIKNTVTKFGVDYILGQIDTYSTQAFSEAGPFRYIALGTGQATPNTDYYQRNTLFTEVPNAGSPAYARKDLQLSANNAGITIGAGRTDASSISWKVTFAAGFVASTTTINEVGVYDVATINTEYLLAGTSFAGISVSTAQEVQATYTITITQA